MASLFKRGNRYYLAFHDTSKSPQRKQVSLKVSHYRAARKKADQLSREFEEGRYSPWVKKKEDEGDISIGDAIARFVATRQNLSPQSIQKYQSVLGQFLKWAPEKKTLKQVCQDDIQAFIDSGNRKPVTKKTYSTTLSPFFNWCVKTGLLFRSPVAGVRLPKIQQFHHGVISHKEVQVLYETIERYSNESKHFSKELMTTWTKSAVKIAIGLGLRAGEICQLRREDVEFDNRLLCVGNRDGFLTKSGRPRVIPLTEKMIAEIQHNLKRSDFVVSSSSGRQLSPRYLSRRFKFFSRLAGLPEHIRFHSLRHTACTNLIESGVPLEAVRIFMGHSSIRVTQRYIHYSPLAYQKDVSQALSRIESASSIDF